MAESTRRNHYVHLFGENFYGQFNVVYVTMKCLCLESCNTLASHHTILAFIVPVLLNFLELKYQGKNESPFETHPQTMLVANISLLIYCLSYQVMLRISSSNRTPYYANTVQKVMVFFGTLSMVSLYSVLFPDSIRPILYLLPIGFSAGDLLYCKFCRFWSFLYRRIMVKIGSQSHMRERFRRETLTHQTWVLPQIDAYQVDSLPV